MFTQFHSWLRSLSIPIALLGLIAASAPAEAASVGYTGPTNYLASGSDVAVADFNGDSRPDLATNRGAVLLGDGSGGFTGPIYFAVGEGTKSVAVGDFNGDLRADVAITHEYHQREDGEGEGNVSIHLGDGAGGFSVPTYFGAEVVRQPQSLAVGDFNPATASRPCGCQLCHIVSVL